MEYFLPSGLYARKPVRDIQVEGVDDCVLGNVLDLVGLSIRVWHVGILVVVVDPIGGGGKGFIGICTQQVKRMTAFVNEDGEIAIDTVEQGDVAVGIISMTSVGVRKGNHVADILPCMDGKTAKKVNHVDQWIRAGFVPTHHPSSTAVVVMNIERLNVDWVKTCVLGYGFAICRNISSSPLVPGAVGWV